MKVMCTVIETVGDLKGALKDVPDDYKINPCGLSSCLALINDDEKSVLLDESRFINENYDLEEFTEEEREFINSIS